MYIIIFEDGQIFQQEELDSGILPAAESGYVDVLDITDPTHPLRYFDEGWCSLDVAENTAEESWEVKPSDYCGTDKHND